MPKRRADATGDDPVTPRNRRRRGCPARRPTGDATGEAAGTDREPLPAPGAESEPEQAALPPEAPVETVTVDEAVAEPAPEPELAAAEARDEPGDEHHDEEGMSWPARFLTALVLIIAGAALGVWGAPKLAPLMPSGLRPVADWLAPGKADAEAEIAALRARARRGDRRGGDAAGRSRLGRRHRRAHRRGGRRRRDPAARRRSRRCKEAVSSDDAAEASASGSAGWTQACRARRPSSRR